MKIHLLAISWVLLALAAPLRGDTFVLKDGSKLEGRILRQDGDSYLLEVQVTKSIRDERLVAKADVVKIERHDPEKVDFSVITQLVPVPDLLTAADYAARIRKVEHFIASHRMTANSREAMVILAKLQAEAAEVAAGAIKLEGQMISAAERQTNAYEVDARIQAFKIRRMVQDRHTLQALRAFSAFERDFPNTTARAELVPLMAQVINAYVADTLNILKGYEARVKERKAGLASMTVQDRKISQTAIREQSVELAHQFKREKDAQQLWVTRHPYSKESLEDAVTSGRQELSRLSAMASELTPEIDGGQAFRNAMHLIQRKGEEAAIKAAIAAAKSASVPETYLAMLRAARAAAAPPEQAAAAPPAPGASSN